MTSKLRRSERDSVVPTALCDYLTLFSLQAFRALLYIPAYNLTPLQGCDSDIKNNFDENVFIKVISFI